MSLRWLIRYWSPSSTKASDRSFSIEPLSRLDKVALVVSAGAQLLYYFVWLLVGEEKRTLQWDRWERSRVPLGMLFFQRIRWRNPLRKGVLYGMVLYTPSIGTIVDEWHMYNAFCLNRILWFLNVFVWLRRKKASWARGYGYMGWKLLFKSSSTYKGGRA